MKRVLISNRDLTEARKCAVKIAAMAKIMNLPKKETDGHIKFALRLQKLEFGEK